LPVIVTITVRRISRVPNAPDLTELLARLDHIQRLTEKLAKVRGDTVEQVDLAARINREIEAARLAVKAPLD
jgi:hypothetical protein